MEKITNISPAFDRRDPDPSKNYGIHGCDLRMILKGELGAVQFVLSTNWMLPSVREESLANPKSISYKEHYPFTFVQEPMPVDIGYHSPTPLYEDQLPIGQRPKYDDDFNQIGVTGEPSPCEYLDGKPCYYDGSSLGSIPIWELLLKEGSDGVWKYLEEYYVERFGELK